MGGEGGIYWGQDSNESNMRERCKNRTQGVVFRGSGRDFMCRDI